MKFDCNSIKSNCTEGSDAHPTLIYDNEYIKCNFEDAFVYVI